MPSRRHPAGLLLAGALALAVALVPVSSASTVGGLSAGGLAGETAATRALTEVRLAWTAVTTSSGWGLGGLTLTADSGERFQAGDTVKVALVRPEVAACEVSGTVATTGAAHSVTGRAITDRCGAVELDDLASVAVSITGTGRTTTASGGLGGVAGTLSTFSGAVTDPALSVRADSVTSSTAGVQYVDRLTLDLARRPLSVADLEGVKALVRLHHSRSGQNAFYDTAISSDPAAPAHAAPAPDGSLRVAIDTAALARASGAPRPRVSDADRFEVVLQGTQRLGPAGHGADYSLAIGAGRITATGSGAEWAVDAVGLDSRLRYSYDTAETNDDAGSLSFCHSFTVTNTSSASVTWTVTFDTSLAPLWGFNPTQLFAFRSSRGWRTLAYDSDSHLWTIGGPLLDRTLRPGESTVGSYCVDRVPTPEADPDRYTTSFSRAARSSALLVTFDLEVTSPSRWNVPWQLTVDLADHVCAAGLAGRTVVWNPAVSVVSAHGTVYTIRGSSLFRTRFVSATRSVRLTGVASFIPADGQSGAVCPAGRSVPARFSSPAATAEPEPAAPSAQPAPTAPPGEPATPTASPSGTPGEQVEPAAAPSATPERPAR